MGFFSRKLEDIGKSAAKKEISHYRDFVRGMDSEELGSLLALSYHMGNGLRDLGWPIHDPMIYRDIDNRKLSVIELRKMYAEFQKNGLPTDAAALAIWVHTFRSVVWGELRHIAKECWQELARGRPYIEHAATNTEMISGKRINYEGFEDFPIGFDPHK